MSENILQKIIQPSVRGRIWRAFVLIMILVIIGSMIDAGTYYNKGSEWLASKTNNVIVLPKTKEIPFRLGLDLLGGTHLVYQADVSQVPSGDRVSAVEGVRDVIERRVNVFGVSEPVVQTNQSGGEYRVIVELAGISDVNEAIQMIGETPLLEFKEQDTAVPTLNEDQQAQMDEYNQDAEQRAEDVLGKVLSGGDFAVLAQEFSEDSNTSNNGGSLGWITEADYPEIYSAATGLEIGQSSQELARASYGFEILKVVDRRTKTNPFTDEPEKKVLASHLLICYEGVEGCENGLTKDEAYAKIKEIKEQATPDNFADLVKQNSTEPGAAEREGSLGWFGPGEMVEPFEVAAFDTPVGTISYVVETMFGYHLIYVQDSEDIQEINVNHILIRTQTPESMTGQNENWMNTELTGKNLKRATIAFNPNDNMPEVSLEFDAEGSDLFADITERNVGKPVAIYLDGYPISVPTVNEKITGGKAVISGNFNIQEAKLLAQRLNAGALPVPINLVNQQTIGPSLGHASLNASLEAAIIGLILVFVFMLIFYRLPGLLAILSLVIYGILVLAIFKLWPVTLTLAGMAGFILSIGMAVDANVLIFERLKEELRLGKPMSLAIRDAFERAWPSIRDGNFSTLITCFILVQFSTSVVKGFAITLGLGVVISMFSAIVVTKTLLQLFAGERLSRIGWLFGVKLNDSK